MPTDAGIRYFSNHTLLSILSAPSPDGKRPALPDEMIVRILAYRSCWILSSFIPITKPICFQAYEWETAVISMPSPIAAKSVKLFRQMVIRIYVQAYDSSKVEINNAPEGRAAQDQIAAEAEDILLDDQISPEAKYTVIHEITAEPKDRAVADWIFTELEDASAENQINAEPEDESAENQISAKPEDQSAGSRIGAEPEDESAGDQIGEDTEDESGEDQISSGGLEDESGPGQISLESEFRAAVHRMVAEPGQGPQISMAAPEASDGRENWGWTMFALGIEHDSGKLTWSDSEPRDQQRTIWYSASTPVDPLSYKVSIPQGYGLLKELKAGDRIMLAVRAVWSQWVHRVSVDFELWEEDDVWGGREIIS